MLTLMAGWLFIGVVVYFYEMAQPGASRAWGGGWWIALLVGCLLGGVLPAACVGVSYLTWGAGWIAGWIARTLASGFAAGNATS